MISYDINTIFMLVQFQNIYIPQTIQASFKIENQDLRFKVLKYLRLYNTAQCVHFTKIFSQNVPKNCSNLAGT